MDRRQFHYSLAAVAAQAALREWPRFERAPRVNGARLNRHIAGLAAIGGASESRGSQRVAYTEFDRQGRAYVLELMRAAGLGVRTDAAANLVGRRAGRRNSLTPIVLGSHIDTVPNGGNYDGVVGSLGAIEVAQTLVEQDIGTEHPLEVIIFQNEEGGTIGSSIIAGDFPAANLELQSQSGPTIREGIRLLGGDPERLHEVVRAPGSITAYLELHIEQGGTLDRERINVGIVEGIVGIRWFEVTVQGFANHAGTTPMDQRQDALLTAARVIDAINSIARSIPGRHVATVGKIAAEPGATNVVPGVARFSIDIRDLALGRLDELEQRIQATANQLARDAGTTISFRRTFQDEPAPTDPRLRALIEREARNLRFTTRQLPSGAGHDAAPLSRLGPMAMIFVPSVRGISHSPREYSHPEDITRGADLLLASVLAVDKGGWTGR
jgi:N-carbamoyl-L-amino-acid hydrolase